MSRAGYSAVKVEVFFDLSATNSDGLFIIGQSLIEGTDVLAGEVATDITEWCYAVSTARGRSRELDTQQTGTCQVRLRNYDGRFLPDVLNALSPYAGEVFPGKRVRVAMAANDQPIFDGRIDDWHYQFDVDGRVDAWFEAIDALGSLASMSFDDWSSTAGQTPGERLDDVLDRPEVDWGPARSIGTGVTTLQADAISWGSNVLNYCALVAATDRGLFFAARDNTLTFIGRDELVLAATAFNDDPSLILTDDLSSISASWSLEDWEIDSWELGVATGGVPFAAIEVASSSELLFTQVGVDREGGTLQTVTSATARDAYGPRSLQLVGLLMETDDQANSLARYLLGQYSQPQNRVSSITVILDSLDPSSPIDYRVPLYEIGDIVKVKWTPTGSSSVVEQLSVVEGKFHQITVDGVHTCRLALSPADNLSGFIIGDAQFGVIGVSRIAF